MLLFTVTTVPQGFFNSLCFCTKTGEDQGLGPMESAMGWLSDHQVSVWSRSCGSLVPAFEELRSFGLGRGDRAGLRNTFVTSNCHMTC